jgi:hypothetical protein
MFRTYLSPAGEEEGNLGKDSQVFVRVPYFEAVVRGYLKYMQCVLTPIELSCIVFAGQFALFMQAVRFLDDYLSGDKYFKTSYPEQNLTRALNQLKLLKEYTAMESELQEIVDRIVCIQEPRT